MLWIKEEKSGQVSGRSKESSRTSTSEEELMWKSSMLKNTTDLFEEDRLLA